MQLKRVMKEAELLREALKKSMDYPAYRDLVARQARDGQTSGAVQSESLIHYTKMNHQRMRRWDRTLQLPEGIAAQLREQDMEQVWLVLTETWCGDAAPVLPVMQAFAMQSPRIALRIALRDQHPDLIARYPTDGAMAIPKLLVLQPSPLRVLASWGPRPKLLMEKVRAYKAAHGGLSPEFRESLQRWYNQDKGKAILAELAALLALEDIGNGAFLR